MMSCSYSSEYKRATNCPTLSHCPSVLDRLIVESQKATKKQDNLSTPNFRNPAPGELGTKEIDGDKLFESIEYWQKWNETVKALKDNDNKKRNKK